MRILAACRSWWKSIREPKRLDGDIDEELRFHIERYAEDLMKTGCSRPEALGKAHREFGAMLLHKEDCRASLGLRWADELRSDLKYGFRMLRRDRVLTAVAVLSLALGIGVNTVMFSVAKTVLFDSLPVSHPEDLRLLSWEFRGRDQPVGMIWGNGGELPGGRYGSSSFSYPVYRLLLAKKDLFRGLAAFSFVHKLPVVIDGSAESLSTQLVSGNLFEVLGVNSVIGRNIQASDLNPDAPAVAVASYELWAHRFGRSPDILGATIRVNTVPVTIVGVAPQSFGGPQMDASPALTMPLSLQPRIDLAFDGNRLENGDSWWLQLLARKRPDVADERLQAGLSFSFHQAAQATLPKAKASDAERLVLHIRAGNRGEDGLRKRFLRPVYVLWSLVGLVLLLACSNVANLLLARATSRQSEMATRQALGASPSRIARQMFIEGSLLAGLAAVSGLIVAYALHNLMLASLPQLPPTSFDWQVCIFAAVTALVAALLFGFAPALQASRSRLETNENLRATANRSKVSARNGLVIFQVALSALLLIASGLFCQTLLNLSKTELGIEAEHLLLFDLNLPDTRYPGASRIATQRRLMDRLQAIPGVRNASVARDALASGVSSLSTFKREDQARGEGDEVASNIVDIRFFKAAGIPILRGRGFSERDTDSSRKVAVINSKLAQNAFPNENPLGKTFNDGVEIVGIARDAMFGSLREGEPAAIYWPFTQMKFWGNLTFYVRTSSDPKALISAIRKAVQSIDPDLPVTNMRTQPEQVGQALSQERLFALVSSAFALLALALGAIGVYGVTQFSVSRRTNEIGIRMALGAKPRNIIAAVMRGGLTLVSLGLAIGVGAALVFARFIASMFYGVRPSDPLTIAAAALILAVTAVAALWQPARRASKITPLEALRHE